MKGRTGPFSARALQYLKYCLEISALPITVLFAVTVLRSPYHHFLHYGLTRILSPDETKAERMFGRIPNFGLIKYAIITPPSESGAAK